MKSGKAGMRPVIRRILYLTVLLLGLGWVVLSRPAAGSTTAGRIPAPQVGFQAPAFTLTNLAGQIVNLSDYQGQVVLLNFWASWCPPCRAEMPAFEQVYQSYQGRGLVVLAVNASNQDTPEDRSAFLGSFTHSFTILPDESGAVNQLYAITSLPTTFFIGRDGTIRDVVIGGPLTIAGLSTRVETLLQEVP
jgi:cytochrome c biogenesis protein CcmG/thiol:disulfide interchange protein DsbE